MLLLCDHAERKRREQERILQKFAHQNEEIITKQLS